MKRFYKYIPLLFLLLPLASSQSVAAESQPAQAAQGPADGLTPQQREQHFQKARRQQEKMQEAQAKMLREMDARRLQEEIKN